MLAPGSLFCKLIENNGTRNFHTLTDFLYNYKALQPDISPKDLAIIFLCAEVKMMLSAVDCIKNTKSSDHRMYFDTICESLQEHVTFLRKYVPQLKELDKLQKCLISLQNNFKNKESLKNNIMKLDKLLIKSLPQFFHEKVPATHSEPSCISDYIPLAVTLPHLVPLFLPKSSLDKQNSYAGIHALDDCLVSSKFNEILSRLRTSKTTLSEVGDQEKLVSSWQNKLRSLEDLINNAYLKPSRETQTVAVGTCSRGVLTTDNSVRQRCLISLTNLEDDFLADAATPPVSPIMALDRTVPRADLSSVSDVLSFSCSDKHNMSLCSASSFSRNRVPWTLEESLMLWHEARKSERPSWSLIWRNYFRSSRRTQGDLKDRWRIISRNQVLQANIRRAYSDWLENKKSKTVRTSY